VEKFRDELAELRRHIPFGIFAVNDGIAIKCIDIFREEGLSIGKDVAVVGFDNVSESEYPSINLTTVAQNGLLLGQTAADIAIDKIEGKVAHVFKSIIPNWLQFDVSEILVIDFRDDGCESVWDIIEPLNDPRIKVIETKHEYRWVTAIARNIACRFALYEKMLMLDVDYILSENFFDKHDIDDRKFITGDRIKDSRSGLLYLTKSQFNKVNGYNENLMYWGHADMDFYNRLSKAGFTQEYADLTCVTHKPHSPNMSFENQMCLNNLPDWIALSQFNIYLCHSVPWTPQSNRIKWSLNQTEYQNRFLAARNFDKDLRKKD
jgi:hypothetical protein